MTERDELESLLISCLAAGALRKISYDKWGPLFEGAHVANLVLADDLEPQMTAEGAIPAILGRSAEVDVALECLFLAGRRMGGMAPTTVRLTPSGHAVAVSLVVAQGCPVCDPEIEAGLCLLSGFTTTEPTYGCLECHGTWEPRVLALMHLAAQHRATGIWRGISGPH